MKMSFVIPMRNVVLTDRQASFVDGLIRSGRFQNASEVLLEGLALLEGREAAQATKLETLSGELPETDVVARVGELQGHCEPDRIEAQA